MQRDMPRRTLAEIEARIARLRPGYLSRRSDDLERLRAAAARGDFDRVERIAHDLRGTAGGYGLPELGRVGAELEEAARRRDHARVQRLLDGLAAALTAAGHGDQRGQRSR